MPKFEDLTILSIKQIISKILSHCLSDFVSAREALQAIKSPSTIETQVMKNEDLRKLLIEWRSKSRGDADAGQTLRTLIKTQLPPRSSRFMRGMTYPGNPADLCIRYVLIWLRIQLYPPSDSLHPKIMFYRALAAMPETVTPQWEGDWMRAMEGQRLLPPGAMNPHFLWSCENIFTKRVFRIQPCLWQYFPRVIIKLINDLLTYRLNGFILILSRTINHAMAATVKIREGYITFKFFDPNAPYAEQTISLLLSQPERWEESIVELTHRATEYSRIQRDADCTMVCLPHSPFFPSSLAITDWNEFQPMSHEQRTLCLHGCLEAIGGKREDYINYVKHLIDDIPPKYFGMLINDVTILVLAAYNGYETVVDIILKAVLKLPWELAKLLLQPRANGATPLFIAAESGHYRIVAIILDAVLIITRRLVPHGFAQLFLQPMSDGATALFVAAQNGHKRVVEIILSVLPNLSLELAQLLLQPCNGETALYIAASRGHDGVIDAILKGIFNLRISKPECSLRLIQPKPNGETALLVALENGHERVIEIILDALPKWPLNLAQPLLQPMQGGLDPLELAIGRHCSQTIISKLQALKAQFKV